MEEAPHVEEEEEAMKGAPFSAGHELYGGLEIVQSTIQRRSAHAHPATGANQAALQHAVATKKTHLPGDPRVELGDPDIGTHLQEELMTDDLNMLAPHLWLVAKQDSEHISSLTDQIVRGRTITITEKPGLHLVWVSGRVFVKPLPKYLLSHAFWQHYLVSAHSPIAEPMREQLAQAARGFLRSYAYLVQHKSDFVLATQEETRLIPEGITFTDFIRFIARCRVSDKHVSPRYHFGELRLTRLNFWAKFILFKSHYHKVEWQYGAYFARFYGPILFIFAVFSLLLSAMQVVLAVQTIITSDNSWLTFAKASRGFSVFTVFFIACITASLLFMLTALFANELIFALHDLYRKKHPRRQKKQN